MKKKVKRVALSVLIIICRRDVVVAALARSLTLHARQPTPAKMQLQTISRVRSSSWHRLELRRQQAKLSRVNRKQKRKKTLLARVISRDMLNAESTYFRRRSLPSEGLVVFGGPAFGSGSILSRCMGATPAAYIFRVKRTECVETRERFLLKSQYLAIRFFVTSKLVCFKSKVSSDYRDRVWPS